MYTHYVPLTCQNISWVLKHPVCYTHSYLLFREEEKRGKAFFLCIVILVSPKYNLLKFSNATLTAYNNNKIIAAEKFAAVIQATVQNDACALPSAIVKQHK